MPKSHTKEFHVTDKITWFGFALLLVLLLVTKPASAIEVWKPNEFSASSPDCRAIYASLRIGIRYGYGDYLPNKKERAKWHKIGDLDGGYWHFCNGMVLYRRAEVDTKPSQKLDLYDKARKEFMFTFNTMEKSRPKAPGVATMIARVLRRMNQPNNAEKFLKRFIKMYPDSASLYAEYGLLYYYTGEYVNSKQMFLKANDLYKGESSEIVYFLGLVAIKNGNIDEAKKYATKAYAMGYPLKGLSKKIAQYESKNRVN